MSINQNPKVLSTRASQLALILSQVYNPSLKQDKIPVLWKIHSLVLVLKKVELNLTSSLHKHVMKTLEKVVLDHLRVQVKILLDPL